MLRPGQIFLILIVALLAAVLVLPPAAPALGISGFNLSRTDQGKADSSFHFNLKPGESIEKELILKNTTTDTTQNLKIYAADALPTNNGGIALRGRFEPKKGVAKWIKLDAPEEITLGPNEERRISFKLSVPAFSDKYEKIGSIVVEGAAKQPQPDGQFIIKVLPRVALLVYQRLPGPGITRLKITKFDWGWDKRNVKFDLGLRNVGDISTQPRGRINIYNIFGKADVIPLENMKTLFPNDASEISPVWKDTPAMGYFTADVKIFYGKNWSETRKIDFLIFPWWILAILPALWLIARGQRKLRAARELRKLKAAQAEAEEDVVAGASALIEEALIDEKIKDMPEIAPVVVSTTAPQARATSTTATKKAAAAKKRSTGTEEQKAATKSKTKRASSAKTVTKPATKKPATKPTAKTTAKSTTSKQAKPAAKKADAKKPAAKKPAPESAAKTATAKKESKASSKPAAKKRTAKATKSAETTAKPKAKPETTKAAKPKAAKSTAKKTTPKATEEKTAKPAKKASTKKSPTKKPSDNK